MSEHVTRSAERGIRRVKVLLPHHTPANKRKGQVKAHAELVASLSIYRTWLELHATEFVEGHKGVRRNMVWITMEEEGARAIYEMLHERFGGAP
jgi:hypothetical protein